MKKLIFMAAMALMAVTASAEVEQGFRNGIRIDLGATNINGEGDNATFGYGLGWVAEYNFNSHLYLQSGINIENIAHQEDAIDGTINAFFGQLPIHVGYRFNIGDSSAFFLQAGPTLGVGLFGTDIEWNNGYTSNIFDSLKRFDLGIGGRLGFEFSGFQVGIGINYGVLNAIDSDVNSYHSMAVNLNLAYMF